MEKSQASQMQRAIEKEQYYHGFLPREDVKTVLKRDGDFLLRISEPRKGESRSFILSVFWNKPPNIDEDTWIKHYVVKQTDKEYFIEKNSFPSLQELVEHHLKKQEPIKDNVMILKPLVRQPWELDHENIQIIKKLGEGAFGEVSLGKLKFRKGGKTVSVAIKQAKLANLTKDQIKEFMGEARVMRGFAHPNIVRFYGVAAGIEPLFMVMELASNGALDSFLKKNTDMPIERRNEMILQAAWGIEYLHLKPMMHRDIAARNCLYGDGKVKISDFGLSRTGTSYQADANKKAPIRWLSPEVIRARRFSLQSDVWAFAIMAWEIYNDGQEPYPGMMVIEVATKVMQGMRMELPEGLHPDIKAVLLKCWAENETDRPLMKEVAAELERVTGTTRPDFAQIENQLRKEMMCMNNITQKTVVRKTSSKQGSKARAIPKGMNSS